MRIVVGASEGRETLLRRAPLDEPQLPESARELTRRVFGAELDAAMVVDRIMRDVQREGDAAVRRYNESIDGVRDSAPDAPLEVSRQQIEQAYSRVEPELVGALKDAADRIRSFHERQLEHSIRSFEDGGLGQVVRPLQRVGMYVPGTQVVYPSTVLMTALPARVAGVSELIMATPVGPDGEVAPLKLVAADIAGVDRIFRAGGVQGIAAMAYGTETIPRVDKICGPGNIFVTLAKKKVYGEVGVDGIFGPSETLVVADETADAAMVAADLLAGAEHDELATAVLITNSRIARRQRFERGRRGSPASWSEAAWRRRAFEARGGIVLVDSIDEAIELASEFAPEHLCLHVENVDEAIARVRNAGCIFAGAHSVESIGDYTAGPSHVMPTGGSAAFASPLGVHDFLKADEHRSPRSSHGRCDRPGGSRHRAGRRAHGTRPRRRIAAPEATFVTGKSRAKRDILGLVKRHLIEMPGYEPVEPIDVVAERLGHPRAPGGEAGCQREPLRPVTEGGAGAGAVRLLQHLSRSGAVEGARGCGGVRRFDAGADRARQRVGRAC